jgi:hypothetical protein
MKIETVIASAVPPALFELHRQGCKKPHYDQLAEALLGTKPGDWVRIALADMPQSKKGGNARLHTNAIEAMRNRKIGRVRTQILGAHFWATVIRETPKAK